MTHRSDYKGLIASDWSQCLAPSGPFDAISFRYPRLQNDIAGIFRRYTNNEITLASAVGTIDALIPAPLSKRDMDAYLTRHFRTYDGVAELMRWCRRNQIVFMINTTGPLGYFQRVLARGLLPEPAALAAHPAIQFSGAGQTDLLTYPLLEITDKGLYTARAADHFGIPHEKIIVIGDSGGDGPHFEWAGSVGATTIASMAKPSLLNYCSRRHLKITHRFGHTYADGEPVAEEKEAGYDFMGLSTLIGGLLGLTSISG
jgi:hypothetical protein